MYKTTLNGVFDNDQEFTTWIICRPKVLSCISFVVPAIFTLQNCIWKKRKKILGS